ncbi:MAG: membrane protein insertion efficiency factor YidD [Clostridia bacterium]|nr:membrane protein insertion efficiency factor YidD [Clostridia bacterium]
MKYVCISLIRLYQKILSPLKRNPTCRFTPTCSAYAIEAFTKRGFFVGMALTVRRIFRCNPFCAGGYDPVPPKKIPKYQDKAENNKDAE